MADFKITDAFDGLKFRAEGDFKDLKKSEDETLPLADFTSRGNIGLAVMPTRIRRANTKEWFVLENEPIVNAAVSKEVVVTTINRGNGRRGTVKEEMYLSDYAIEISGIIMSDSDRFPKDKIEKLRRLLEEPGALDIENLYFKSLGIYRMVVTDISWERNDESKVDFQYYTLRALSDEDFELEIV